MVIILCVCLCVYRYVHKILVKLQSTNIGGLNKQLAVYYIRIKNNKRLLLKPFSYKVNSQLLFPDSWGQLDTSRHNYSCIIIIILFWHKIFRKKYSLFHTYAILLYAGEGPVPTALIHQ